MNKEQQNRADANELTDAQFNAYGETAAKLECRIVETPARTLDGVAVKLRRIKWGMEGGVRDQWDHNNMQSVFQALNRMAWGRGDVQGVAAWPKRKHIGRSQRAI